MFTVQSYRGEKHLSWPKEGGTAVPIGDIGQVAKDTVSCDTTWCHSTEVLSATISTYNARVTCKAKVELFDAPITRCTKCSMEQLINCLQQFSAQLILSQIAADTITVSAFTKVILDITVGKAITTPNLLQAAPFTANIQAKTLISITRQAK